MGNKMTLDRTMSSTYFGRIETNYESISNKKKQLYCWTRLESFLLAQFSGLNFGEVIRQMALCRNIILVNIEYLCMSGLKGILFRKHV